MDEPLSLEEIDAKVEELVRANPGRDIRSILGGQLAGPASPDRPPVPIWAFPSWLESHPELSLADLSGFRFPLVLYGGTYTVVSIEDDVKVAPPPAPQPPFLITAADVVRRYELVHEAGGMTWNEEIRTMIEVLPSESYARDVGAAWILELQNREA